MFNLVPRCSYLVAVPVQNPLRPYTSVHVAQGGIHPSPIGLVTYVGPSAPFLPRPCSSSVKAQVHVLLCCSMSTAQEIPSILTYMLILPTLRHKCPIYHRDPLHLHLPCSMEARHAFPNRLTLLLFLTGPMSRLMLLQLPLMRRWPTLHGIPTPALQTISPMPPPPWLT